MKKATIVIPTYNEAKNIKALIEGLNSAIKNLKNWDVSFLIVDSSSPDQTATRVKTLQKEHLNLYLLETKKEGLGKAYVRGFTYALKKLDPDILFEMDADLSHEPEKIPLFLQKIDAGADFVIGSRYMKDGSIPKNWAFYRKLFSIVGNLIIRFGFMKLKISDWTSGYRAIRASIVRDSLGYIQKYSGYVFQVALLDFALKRHAVVSQIPINFIDRIYGKSKINSAQFIIQTLLYVFQKSSFIRYGIVGVIGAVIDFGLSFVLIEIVKFPHYLFWLATLISAEASIISNFLFNNFWSFAHKRLEHKFSVFISSFAKFNTIAAGALAIQAVGIQLLTNIFGPEYWFIYKFFILALIVIPYSYILYNRIIWKKK